MVCGSRHGAFRLTNINAVGRCFLCRMRTLNAFLRRHSDSTPNSAGLRQRGARSISTALGPKLKIQLNKCWIINSVGIHVTIIRHWILYVQKPGHKYKLVDMVATYIFIYQKRICISFYHGGIHYCTAHKCSKETVIPASRLIDKFDHCYNVVYKYKRRSQLSKATNLLLKIAFSIFCHSEFVYDTGSV